MHRSPRSLESRGARSLLFREVVAHPAQFSRIRAFDVRTSPLLLLAMCLAAGILCRSWWQPAPFALTTCVGLLIVAAVAWRWSRRLAWPATAVAFIALGWTAALLQPTRLDTSMLRYTDGLQRSLEVEVQTARLITGAESSASSSENDVARDEEPAADREVLQVRALRVEDVSPDRSVMQPISGGVLLTLRNRANTPVPLLACGSHVVLTVRMHAPRAYRDPGAWNYAVQAARNGVSTTGVADAGTMRYLPAARPSFDCRLQALRYWSSRRIAAMTQVRWMRQMPSFLRFRAEDAAVLNAMLLGDRTTLDQSVRVDFERTGSFHLLVVAGVHITLLTGGLYWLCLRLRASRWLTLLITVTVSGSYALLTGFGDPVQRAFLMMSMFLIMLSLDRDRQVLNALGAALLVMLVADPQSLFDASLQMTALSVIAIGGIAAPLLERTFAPCARAMRNIEDTSLDIYLRPSLAGMRCLVRMSGRLLAAPSKKQSVSVPQRVPAWLLLGLLLLLDTTLLTAVAEMVMALPMAIYFHRLTPFAAPANLIVLPLIGTLLGCATVTFLFAILHPLLGALPAVMTAAMLHTVNWIIHGFSSLQGADIRVPAPALLCVAVALLCWSLAVVWVRSSRTTPAYIAAAITAVGFGLILVPPAPRIAPDAMSVTAIDVNQGDSLLVTTSNGHSMVVDAGGPTGPEQRTSTSRFDVGEDVVSPFLWSRKLRRIDVLAVTHAHSDHLGGALAVLRNFRPRELWLSVPAPALAPILQEAQREGTTVRYLHAGDTAQLGSVAVAALSPAADYLPGANPGNDDSLVLQLRYGKASALLEGDAERGSERAMQPLLTPVTLLKVGHHGSLTSSTEPFLDALHAQFAVISCGRDNPFGHPRMPVLQRLQERGVRTSRTDTMGAVQYQLRADGSVTQTVLTYDP